MSLSKCLPFYYQLLMPYGCSLLLQDTVEGAIMGGGASAHPHHHEPHHAERKAEERNVVFRELGKETGGSTP
jgi:hypothetical protein